jgi:hypothetical protein
MVATEGVYEEIVGAPYGCLAFSLAKLRVVKIFSVSFSDLRRRGAKLTRQLKFNGEGRHEDFIVVGDGSWKEREVAKGIGER